MVQDIGPVNGVTHPFNIADVVFLSFIYVEIDVHALLVEGHYAVGYQEGIAVTQFVIFVDEVVLGFLVLLVDKLLRTEPATHVLAFVYGLQHAFGDKGTLDFLLWQVVVTGDVDVVHLHLVFLVDVYVHDDIAGFGGIIASQDVEFGILVALLVEVSLTQNLCPGNGVGRHLVFFHNAQFLFQILAFALLHARIVDSGNARVRGKVDVEVGRIANNAVDGDGHIAEESVAPISTNGIGDLFAGDGNLIAHLQTRQSDEQVVVVVCCSRYGDASEDAFAWSATIVNVGFYFFVQALCQHLSTGTEQQKG